MSALGIIPARLESSRLPRKLLLAETGMPLIVHTWEAVRRAKTLSRVAVLTDSAEIASVLKQAGADYALTGEHASGTDRIAAYIRQVNPPESLVVNIQGDEPEIEPESIDRLVHGMQSAPDSGIGTLAAPIRQVEELLNPACVKVVLGADGRALYFSRAPIPFDRSQQWNLPSAASPFWLRHIGIYAYRQEILRQWPDWPPSRLEQTECLEQLRALERGVSIRVFPVKQSRPGIDTRENYEQFLRRWREQEQSRGE